MSLSVVILFVLFHNCLLDPCNILLVPQLLLLRRRRLQLSVHELFLFAQQIIAVPAFQDQYFFVSLRELDLKPL